MPQIKKNITTFSHIDLALKWVDKGATKILNNGKIPVITLGYDDESENDGTTSQNSKYHAMIGDIIQGAVFKTPARTIVMSEFGARKGKALLVSWFEDECIGNGDPLRHGSEIVVCPFTGRSITVRASTVDFLKKERSNFIEWLYATGTDGGVRWSDASLKEYENYREAQK